MRDLARQGAALTQSMARLQAAAAADPGQIRAALDLRAQVFRAGAPDADRYDSRARHLLVVDTLDGSAVAACRAFVHPTPADAACGYTGQHYDLRALRVPPAPLIELGRFCVAPAWRANPDVPRLLLGRIAAMALSEGAGVLMGCASFPGADLARHGAALGHLWRHHRAPEGLSPPARASQAQPLARFAARRAPAPQARAGVPGLLRAYLALGGWVSDEAVIDRDLDTLHVFTAVPTGSVPAARQRRLQALAST